MRDAPAPRRPLDRPRTGFTVAVFAAKLHALTGTPDAGYSIRQAAQDLRRLRGKQLLDEPGRTRRDRVLLAAVYYRRPPHPREQVIAAILAGIPRSEDAT